MNRAKGNMYHWVTHTWNPITGRCPHDCVYCYMRRFRKTLGEIRLNEKVLNESQGRYGRVIFVGSSTDMFADAVPSEWISKVLAKCDSKNRYLFQSKNPGRFFEFIKEFPNNTILGTTIETDIDFIMPAGELLSRAPISNMRCLAMGYSGLKKYLKMVSIEPIMEFNLDVMVNCIKLIEPLFVSIGADSKGHNLPEPNPEKLRALITELQKITEVKLKPNLNRILE